MSAAKRQPLPERVASQLRDDLRRRRPGDRLPTEAAMADQYGVSVGTLRSALQMLAAKGLIQRRQGSGTYVAPRSPTGHLAIFSEHDLFSAETSPYFLAVIGAVRRRLDAEGLCSSVYSGHAELAETCPEFEEDLECNLIRGIITITNGHGRWEDLARRRQIPVVGTSADSRYCVHSDWTDMGRMGARYLAENGRQRIALIGWVGARAGDLMQTDLVRGFAGELAHQGLEVHREWVRTDLHPGDAGAGWDGFRELWSACPEKPDGLVVTDDMLFRDAALAIGELGIRVPEQLMVIAHANAGRSVQSPFPAARMLADAQAAGLALTEMLMSLLAGREPEPARRTIPHRLEPLPRKVDVPARNPATWTPG